MRKYILATLTLALLVSGCGTRHMVSGDARATLAGAAIGSNIGGAIGGIIGQNNSGWRGGYRGSAIGTIVGAIAGAAIGSAATAPKQQEDYGYRIERIQSSPPKENQQLRSSVDDLKIRNIRFIDDNRNHAIDAGESSKVIFEIVNEGNRTAYNVVPIVTETTGIKRIYISPSVMIEQIAPHNGVKYTTSINAGQRIKTGSITIHIAIADEYGQEYDWQEFALQTQR